MTDLPRRPIDKIKRPVQYFAAHRLSGALLLMAAALVAVVWANSSFRDHYHHLLELDVAVRFGEAELAKHLLHWVNDGLMGIFFFLVGLEIKREVLTGELSTLRKAALPGVAAAGGMIVPALVYFAFNPSGAAASGWGIPMATDIAFALGVLALLGDRVPTSLKVFLTALAIVDDIGAVLVIAVFYTDTIAVSSLLLGLGLWGLSIVFNLLHVRSASAYFVLGTLVWLAFLQSGVHATIAALLMAFTIPAKTNIDGAQLLKTLSEAMERLRRVGVPRDRGMNTESQQDVLSEMNEVVDHASAPLLRLEHEVAPYVTFFVLPLFALANAGVTVVGSDVSLGQALADPLALGIIAGLFVGKQLGIASFSWIFVKLGVADLPSGVRFSQLYGVSMLGGIGFTMSLFIGGLAFEQREMLDVAKVGILAASLLSGVAGYLTLRVVFRGR